MGHRIFNERSFNIWQVRPVAVKRLVAPDGSNEFTQWKTSWTQRHFFRKARFMSAD